MGAGSRRLATRPSARPSLTFSIVRRSTYPSRNWCIERGQTALDWLKGHSVYPGSVVPNRVPYYLLVLASPEQIPLSFDTALASRSAVGRLYFDNIHCASQYKLHR